MLSHAQQLLGPHVPPEKPPNPPDPPDGSEQLKEETFFTTSSPLHFGQVIWSSEERLMTRMEKMFPHLLHIYS